MAAKSSTTTPAAQTTGRFTRPGERQAAAAAHEGPLDDGRPVLRRADGQLRRPREPVGRAAQDERRAGLRAGRRGPRAGRVLRQLRPVPAARRPLRGQARRADRVRRRRPVVVGVHRGDGAGRQRGRAARLPPGARRRRGAAATRRARRPSPSGSRCASALRHQHLRLRRAGRHGARAARRHRADRLAGLARVVRRHRRARADLGGCAGRCSTARRASTRRPTRPRSPTSRRAARAPWRRSRARARSAGATCSATAPCSG